MYKAFTAVLICMAGVSYALTSQASEEPWTFNLYFENDLFDDTDLNYTNGLRLSWVSQDLSTFAEDHDQAYPWINSINQWLEPLHPGSRDQSAHRNLVVSAGQMMFTPEDRYRTTVDPNDRPYAGWLYGGLGYQMRRGDKLNTVEVNVGIVGPSSLAQQSQDFVHQTRNIEVFHGWDNQLDNEFGVQVIFERKNRYSLWSQSGRQGLAADLIPHWGGSIGNVASYLNVGAEFRLGYRLADDFGVSTIRPGAENITPGQGEPYRRALQLYGFVAFDTRLVGNNIFLDGNTFESSHSVDKKLAVADVAVGIAVVYRRWRVSYSQVFRSKEFETQRKSQGYGSLSISYSY